MPIMYLDLIDCHHARLFGISPLVYRCDVTIQSFSIDGMQYVKDILLGILAKYNRQAGPWNKDELYEITDAVNVTILPVAIPRFQINVAAYRSETCSRVLAEIKVLLEEAKFDCMTF